MLDYAAEEVGYEREGKSWCGEKKKRDSRVRSWMRSSINALGFFPLGQGNAFRGGEERESVISGSRGFLKELLDPSR